ncbi:MAG: serine/threonine protein kinase, partial [Anaerolineaceae bacterium]
MNLRKLGRYELTSELGRGGMATVYRAHDPFFDRDVAVKLLPREFLHDPTFKTRFEREAKTIAALEHSAIVPVHDFGEEEGQPFLVMRYMSGGSLVNRLESGPLSFEEISTIISRIATGLDEAHKKGMIHRDLKPGNILFDSHGDAFLSDFGIVKLTQETATFTGTGIIGTPAYMSPEQARGDPDLDPRSDVYALGVILFEMLSGKQPYEADTPMGLAVKHITEPVPSILEVKPDLPPNFELMIKRALAKEPEDRHASAGELAKEFAEMVAAERSYARPPIPTLIEEPP